jgi:hypothetical protein
MREGFALERQKIVTVEASSLHWSALALAFAVIAVSNSSATFQIFAYRNFLVWIPGVNAIALAAILIAWRSNTTRSMRRSGQPIALCLASRIRF